MGAFLTFAIVVALFLSWIGRVLFRGQRDNIVHPVWIAVWVAAVQAIMGVNNVYAFILWSFLILSLLEVIGHWCMKFRPHYRLADGMLYAHATGFSPRRLGWRMLVVLGLIAVFYLFVAVLDWMF